MQQIDDKDHGNQSQPTLTAIPKDPGQGQESVQGQGLIQNAAVTPEQDPCTAAQPVSDSPRKARVTMAGSEALVWDVDDVRFLRLSCRISASLVGSLPRSPLQNIFQGLPLRLMPEEVYALLQKDLIELIDEEACYAEPTMDDEAGPGLHCAITSTASDASASVAGPDPAKNNAKAKFDYIVLHTLSNRLPWYSRCSNLAIPPATISHTICSKQGGSDLDIAPSYCKYPSTGKEQQRCRVFLHLWDRCRFYLAPGMKFGGDYLLYRKDPLTCHSSLIASIKDAEEDLSLIDLANYARLASSVQKWHLICSVDNDDNSTSLVSLDACTKQWKQSKQSPRTGGDIQMFAVEWAGF